MKEAPGAPGFILAGGASRRMGRDKAHVQVDGRPMALRVADALREGGCHNVRLICKQHTSVPPGLPILVEPETWHHPLLGVAVALEAARDEGARLALIAPCDLPFLSQHTIRQLLKTHGPCVAHDGDRVHPLLAVLCIDMADQARRLASEDASAQTLVAGLPRVTVPVSSVHDANCPGDLEAQQG
ncbi:MAG: molybdenum cofactor guanylyltransferase [Myxococcota bacterium]|nr:molybdenum cofactor guanylyltransferase [Myxococcota bacterium]